LKRGKKREEVTTQAGNGTRKMDALEDIFSTDNAKTSHYCPTCENNEIQNNQEEKRI